MEFNPNAKVDTFISLENAPETAAPQTRQSLVSAKPTTRRIATTEYELEAERMHESPRSELGCELSLLEPVLWMQGSWGRETDGWRDSRTNTVLTFDGARRLIEARIAELGLSPKLVHAYPSSHSSIAEDQAFHRLKFEDRMLMFVAAA